MEKGSGLLIAFSTTLNLGVKKEAVDALVILKKRKLHFSVSVQVA